MKLFRTELDTGLSNKLFEINTNQFLNDGLEFYDEIISCELSSEKNANGFRVSGKLKIPLKHSCDRCLIKFDELRITNFYFYLTDSQDILQDKSDDIIYFAKSSNEIDLTNLFREFVLLEKQIKTVCNEDCKGLCSNCGVNLNNQKCNCSLEKLENPWDKLVNFKGTS